VRNHTTTNIQNIKKATNTMNVKIGWKNKAGRCNKHLEVSLNKSARKLTCFLITITIIKIMTYNIFIIIFLVNVYLLLLTVMTVAIIEYHKNAVSFRIDSISKMFLSFLSRSYLISKYVYHRKIVPKMLATVNKIMII
jgi:hypothetical protein